MVESVRADLLQRSQFGIKKYGTTLDENKAGLVARLQHAYEECLDMANYLKWAMLDIAPPVPTPEDVCTCGRTRGQHRWTGCGEFKLARRVP